MTDLNANSSQAQLPVSRRRPFVVQVLIVLGCAVILTGGAIFGVVATCNFNSCSSRPWAQMFFVERRYRFGDYRALYALHRCVGNLDDRQEDSGELTVERVRPYLFYDVALTI